jgi:hypothetical protein
VISAYRQGRQAVITHGPEERFNLRMHGRDVIKILKRHVTRVSNLTKLEGI